VITVRGWATQYLQAYDISGLSTGASQSFHIFSAPYSFIEVPQRLPYPRLVTITIIGPDVITNAKEEVESWWSALKNAASFGKSALTNPDRFKDLDEVKDLKDQIKKRSIR
jgi:hypothetical protein